MLIHFALVPQKTDCLDTAKSALQMNSAYLFCGCRFEFRIVLTNACCNLMDWDKFINIDLTKFSSMIYYRMKTVFRERFSYE